jgi:RNA polymerase sigma-70 factor, ECF subfamily
LIGQETHPTGTIPWDDLVRRCVAGDEAAWNRLIEFAWPMVHGWLVRTCRDPVLADDLAQTVFLRLLEDGGRRLRLYDPGRGPGFPAYLKAIASNLHVDWTRSREGIDRSRWYDLEAARDLAGSSPSPDDGRQVTWILDCLDRLTPREGQALRLLLCGWSYEEIARDLGIGSGGAGALIFRGREHLRMLLEGGPEQKHAQDPSPRAPTGSGPGPGSAGAAPPERNRKHGS